MNRDLSPGTTPAVPPSDEMARLQALAIPAQIRAIQARRRRLTRAQADSDRPEPSQPRLSPRQQSGRHFELAAAHWLKSRGLRLLDANLHTRVGEIDLVADDRGVLVFIEVRHRKDDRHGGAAASVNRSKQRRLIRAAQALLPGLVLRHYQGRQPACRFDVLAWESDRPRWLRGAFHIE